MQWTYGALNADAGLPFPPETDEQTSPFWDLLALGKVAAQHCAVCGQWRFPPGPRCRHCHAASLDWVELASTPRLYSWIVVNRATHPGLPVPYAVCLAEFTEGIRIPAHLLVPDGTGELRAGMELELVVDSGTDRPVLAVRPAPREEDDRHAVRVAAAEA